MRKHLANINFKGDVYFIVGESQENEELDITVKVKVWSYLSLESIRLQKFGLK